MYIYRYAHHTISPHEVYMRIHSGQDDALPEDHANSHAGEFETIKIEGMELDSNQKHINRYNCQYEGCSRTYSTIGNLRTHMKTHKGEIWSNQFCIENRYAFFSDFFKNAVKNWKRKLLRQDKLSLIMYL